MKQMPFYLIMLVLSLIYSCENKKQSVSIDNLIVGKWRMVEYGSSYVNALDTLSFYRSGKADCQPEMGEFTYRLIKPDSLIIYNKDFGEQHFKILKLSNDSLIKRISRQKIYADSIDELVNGEIEKYIRVTDR
jgi:rRNA maturation protein Rpf1